MGRQVNFMKMKPNFDKWDNSPQKSRRLPLPLCSQDTASRDIDDLLARKILVKNAAGGRSTSYSLAAIE